MTDSKLIVVVGATGQQGGSVARVFSQEPGWRVRGITRNPKSKAAVALTQQHPTIELVSGDLDEQASLGKAFAGADAIFSVTDFWQFVKPGQRTFKEAADQGIQPNLLAMEKEVQQGKNIINAAATAHSTKPLHRFIISNLSDSNKWSAGNITHNLHFDGKAQYTTYLHSTHPQLSSISSFVQIGYYLSNNLTSPLTTPYKQNNTFFFPSGCVPNGKPLPYVNPPTDTGHFVRALILSDKSPPGTTILGGHRNLTVEEYAALWGKTLGVKAQVKYLTRDEILA
ncbi:Putative NmrA-like domain, NAD(P)-binding domain superfamily [Septoria linicola]|uniref:NmrA-like domain, NAD(P)-binding domain superfamily n=1 Tax=Septoria linicola TaxID=215465 RepID=A0A9Q9EJR1_9PEZI|nr:Putative NmrA-like domain, NAD(P)-binding domain superfamily [Septoria linicola]